MVSGRVGPLIWLAHGADPAPLTWDEFLASLIFSVGTVALLVGLGYRGIRTFLRDPGPLGRKQVLTWLAVGVLLIVSVLWAFVTSALSQLKEPAQPESFHKHYVNHGGQVGMWQNYHVEVARNLAGEFRVWVSDSYRRPISAQFFEGALNGSPLEKALDLSYAFVRQPIEVRTAALVLRLPGQEMTFRFEFDERAGRTSLKEFCAPEALSPRP